MHPDIEKLAALKENWDGYDGIPVAPQTLKNADGLMRALTYRYDVSATPMSNGTIMLEWVWDGDEYTLEVGSSLISGYVSQVIAKADPTNAGRVP